jgi:hypothetical protein
MRACVARGKMPGMRSPIASSAKFLVNHARLCVLARAEMAAESLRADIAAEPYFYISFTPHVEILAGLVSNR